MDQIVFAHGAAPVMTNQNTYDNLNRLTGRLSAVAFGGGGSALNFNYQYNAANQRTRVTLGDGNYWIFGYDALGQVTNANKYFWDGTPVAGQQFAYAFDTIGNRTESRTGGDQNGQNLRPAGYTNDLHNLNQITSRNVPGYVDVTGLALATNSVTVNGATAYRKWEYFREELPVNNASSAVWQNVIVVSGQATNSGNVFVAQAQENFGYDADGNLTNDGRWTYTWDGENRLINMTSLTTAPAASKYSLTFSYDYMGRRIQTIVSNYNGSGYVAQYTKRFLYDGWNLVAVLNPSSSLVASMIWGTDLSGSMQDAGGVGGLLAENIVGNGVHFMAFDGNGNVAALVNVATGAVSANYEYGPFGEVIRATGPMAKVNPFMFSTKFYDWETGLSYYGYRYYNPNIGRWPSRDPIGRRGGVNLYAFCQNHPVDMIDRLGKCPVIEYSSEGRAYYNGGWFWSTTSESGIQQDTTSAFFHVSATEQNGNHGICDSGGDSDGSNYGNASFVKATVKNTGNASTRLFCVCSISWSARSFNHGAYLDAGGFVMGTVLDQNFRQNLQGSQTTGGWWAQSEDHFAAQQSISLGAGQSAQLYWGIVSISAPPDDPGASIAADMWGSCTCR